MTETWEPSGLREIVKSIKYNMPGWDVYLGHDNESGGWLTLHIISCTPNSYELEHQIYVNHSFLVPMATYNARTWKAWIRDCYEKVWRHEIGEFLMFDGVREFAPHHGKGEDPYRVWHVGDLADTQVPSGEEKFVLEDTPEKHKARHPGHRPRSGENGDLWCRDCDWLVSTRIEEDHS